jgi:hypothetical protein
VSDTRAKDIAMPRGGSRGGGRPPRAKTENTALFGCRIKASNLQWLKAEKERSGASYGIIIDYALDRIKDRLYRDYPEPYRKPKR